MRSLNTKVPSFGATPPVAGVKRIQSPLQALASRATPMSGGVTRARAGRSYNLNPAGLEKTMRQELMPIHLAGGGGVRGHYGYAVTGKPAGYAVGGAAQPVSPLPSGMPDQTDFQNRLYGGPLGELLKQLAQSQRRMHELPQTKMPQPAPEGGGGGENPHSLYNMYAMGAGLKMPQQSGLGALGDAAKFSALNYQQNNQQGHPYAEGGSFKLRPFDESQIGYRRDHLGEMTQMIKDFMHEMARDPTSMFIKRGTILPAMLGLYSPEAGAGSDFVNRENE